jgi:transcriptional regulator with XRE-family HTH domain
MATPTERPMSLREATAEEIRALLARRRKSHNWLAAQIRHSAAYLSRRMTGDTAFDLDDLERIAAALGVSAADIINAAGGDLRTTLRKYRLAIRPSRSAPDTYSPGEHRLNVRSHTGEPAVMRRPARVAHIGTAR